MQAPEELTYDAFPFSAMDELIKAETPEEANRVIGSQGKKTVALSADIYDASAYNWDVGNEVSIEGTYISANGGPLDVKSPPDVKYTVNFPASHVRDKADFSNWNEIKLRLNRDEGISYDDLVKLLGGVQGLKQKIETGDRVTYIWYDEDGQYLSVEDFYGNGTFEYYDASFDE